MEKPNGVMEKPLIDPLSWLKPSEKSQDYYDKIKERFASERELRLKYRPEGTAQYTSDLTGTLGKYEEDPHVEKVVARRPIEDFVECLFIGGGFAALLTSARLRKCGVESIRIVERGADVGGTWYWNRYPGVACDVPSYDYLPLLDEMDYVPKDRFAKGEEIYSHCQAIAEKYGLYDLAVFQTTVTSTTWNAREQVWHVRTNRGDHIRAQFVICANGTLAKPKLTKIRGMESFQGHSFHTSRWDYDYTKADLSGLADKVVGVIGTGATAVQAVPGLGAAAKALYVFQRTPSSIDIRDDHPTDPNWARGLQPGWQTERREMMRKIMDPQLTSEQKMVRAQIPREEIIRRQENANIDYMMGIHARIDEIVIDKDTAEALKPWYMFMCKRPCFHNDYLPTFNRNNVRLIDTRGEGVTEIKEEGVVFDDVLYELDLLIYATGFEVQKTGIYNEIKGTDGLDLTDKYKSGIRTLFGLHSHGYPNLFIMGGYQSSFQFNLTDILNTEGDHIAACIDHVRTNGYQSIEPKHDAEEWWVQEVIKHRGKTSRNRDCTPGYYNFEGESNRRQDGNYNGGFHRYQAFMEQSRQDLNAHYVLTARH